MVGGRRTLVIKPIFNKRRGDAECSDNVGVFCIIIEMNKCTPSTHHRTGPFGPTTALRMRKDGVPASPWMWAKARGELGAVIRLSPRNINSMSCIIGQRVFMRKRKETKKSRIYIGNYFRFWGFFIKLSIGLAKITSNVIRFQSSMTWKSHPFKTPFSDA
jgi:hypothetical protein